MPRIVYSAEKKAEILAAVKQAVKKDGWKGALDAAKAAGYKGGAEGLKKFYYGTKSKKTPGRKPGRRGRPAKAAAPANNDMQSIQKTLDAIVRQRVGAAFDAAIAMLQKARDRV